MSSVLNCKNCGAINQLPNGKTSMYCSFCGNSIEKIVIEENTKSNPLNSKPSISQRKVNIISKREDGSILMGAKRLYRVENGWMVDSYGSTEFVADTYIQTEQVIDKGGVLNLKNRNLKNLSDIISWFSDNELETILKLDISENKLHSLEGIEKFKKLKELNISGNPISDLPQNDIISLIEMIIMVDTPFAEKVRTLSITRPRNVSVTTPFKCKNCNTLIANLNNNSSNQLCRVCHRKKIDTEKAEEVYNAILKGPNPFITTKTPELFKRWDFTLVLFGTIIFIIYYVLKHLSTTS